MFAGLDEAHGMAAIETRLDVGGWRVRWNGELAERARAQGDWPDRTVAEYARQRAAEHPQRIQIIDGDRGLTCGELYRLAQRMAGYFLSISLQPGEVVSFQLPNWWEATVINLAAAMTGLVVNPIVPINRDAEVSYMLGESRSRLMFVPAVFRKFDYAAMMRRIGPVLKSAPRVVVVRGEAGMGDSFDSVIASRSGPGRAADRGPGRGEAADVHLRHHRAAQGRAALSQHHPR